MSSPPKHGNIALNSSGGVSSHASPQRKLPPLKQQLLQQQQPQTPGHPQRAVISPHNGSGFYAQVSSSYVVQRPDPNNQVYVSTPVYPKSVRLKHSSPYLWGGSPGAGVSGRGLTPNSQLSVKAPGQPGVDSRNTRGPRRVRPQQLARAPLVRSMSHQGGPEVPVAELSPDTVSQYLRQNPDVLDQHVAAYVSGDRVKKWLQAKTSGSGMSRGFNSWMHPASQNGEPITDKHITLTRWKNKIQTSKRKLLQELSKDFHNAHGKVTVLLELAECVSAAISADSFTLYSCDSEKQELTQISRGDHDDVIYGVQEGVSLGTSVAGTVAYSREPVRLQNLLEQEKQSESRLTVSENRAHCVLGLPIVDDSDTCFGVVEFYRHSKNSLFTEEEAEMASLLLVLGTTALIKLETHSMMIRQRTLSDFLLEVTKSIFQDIVSMDIVIIKIMQFAQQLVNADRASLFLVDSGKRELYAQIFDVGRASKAFSRQCSLETSDLSLPQERESYPQEIRFYLPPTR